MVRPSRILAIDPGTRHMGIAVLEGGSLIRHGVEVFTRRASHRQILAVGRKKILRLLSDFRPDVVVVEKTLLANNPNTEIITKFSKQIVRTVKRKRLPIIQFAPSTVKKTVCGDGHASKSEVARSMVARFSELKAYLRQDRRWKDKFQSNRFDAVAVAVCGKILPSSRIPKHN